MDSVLAWAMAEAASAQQAAIATREDTSQQRAGRRRRTSAEPQRAQQGATAAAAPAALDTLSRLQQLADASPQVAQLRRLQALADASPQAAQLRRLQALADASPQAAQLRRLQALADASPQAAQLRRLQALADAAAGVRSPTDTVEAAPPNRTGLPEGLKAGVESLSGLSMDHVRVHYNSAQPEQLNALAYAQGSDIHLAQGQERHLPHEAWHVVQQAQGRVRPTLQMKDGVQVNDDAGLEREADVMGERAQIVSQAIGSSFLIQRYADRADVSHELGYQLSPEKLALNIQLSREQRSLPGYHAIAQRVAKWWQTNQDYDTVTGEESSQEISAPYVKRANAGNDDQLLSTEKEAWDIARSTSATNRPWNTELYERTLEKMQTGDGNRTYLVAPDGARKRMSIIVTHTTDSQSQLETDRGKKLKVTHAHSAAADYKKTAILDRREHPDYGNDAEAKVHYFSLTRQLKQSNFAPPDTA
jgi:hypothetical protein